MESLENIKAGDKVVLIGQFYKRVCYVNKVTNKYIFIGNSKFRKSDGYKSPRDVYGYEKISVLTLAMKQTIDEEAVKNQLIKKIGEIDLRTLSVEQLQSIFEIANKNKE